MSQLYEESLIDTLSKVFSPLIKTVSSLALILLAFVSFGNFAQDQNIFDGYEFNEYIVRDYNLTFGNLESDVTFVYFFDLQCSACKAFNPTFTQIKEQYKDKIKFVYKNNPLDTHVQAKGAAYGLQAAVRQDKQKTQEFANQIYTFQEEGLSSEKLKNHAKTAGLDVDKWDQDRRSKEVRREVEWDMEDTRRSVFPDSSNNGTKKTVGQLVSTPTIVLFKNKKPIIMISGGASLEVVSGYIDQALATN